MFWAGLIWAAFMGMVAGNYATNPIFRLPRRDKIFGRTPYCGDCNSELKPKDLFPILSWLSTKGKCRYCGARVPGEYTIAEVWVTIVFILAYIRWGFSEEFILVSFGITAFIMVAMMEIIDGFFSWATLGWAVAFGVVLCALERHTLYPAMTGGFYGFMVAVALWKLTPARINPMLPNYVPLAAAYGVWLGIPEGYNVAAMYVGFLLLTTVIYVDFGPFKRIPISAAAALALTIFLLIGTAWS